MRGWFRSGQRFLGGPPAHRQTRYVRLAVEILEDRCLPSGYLQTNLVSDLPGLAPVTDPNLVNPWGLVASPTGPFWVSDNGTGVSTLYNGQGQTSGKPLIVRIPGPAGNPNGPGTPTGTVFNSGSGFVVSANGQSGSSRFLFATEDGLIAGWNPAVDFTHAIVAVDNSATGATYKGLALDTDSTGRTLLYATNFATGAVDVFDQRFQAVHLTGSFADPNLPAGFAPYGIQNINGNLYVAYAKQDAAKYDDVPGSGNGFVDVFNGDGVLQQRLVSQGPLNSPWGLALAPANFGEFSQDLLVGNFGDGRINVFEPSSGHFLGQLADAQGNPLTIDHLWGLEFGNGAGGGNTDTLFFNAGIDNQQHGLFGKLQSTENLANDANSNDTDSTGIYSTTAVSRTSGGGQADQVDNYPLPPAVGPALRGDIQVQPQSLPVLFPLKDPPAVNLVPTLLTVSEGPRNSAGTQGTSMLLGANSGGNGSDLTATPASVGLGSAGSSGGQNVTSPSGSGAVETLLSLRTQTDVLEQVATNLPKSGNLSPAAQTVSVEKNDRRIATAILDPYDSMSIQELRAVTPPQDGGTEQSTESLPMIASERGQAEHERALEATDALTVLLVTIGASLLWNVRFVPCETNRSEESHRAPTLRENT